MELDFATYAKFAGEFGHYAQPGDVQYSWSQDVDKKWTADSVVDEKKAGGDIDENKEPTNIGSLTARRRRVIF